MIKLPNGDFWITNNNGGKHIDKHLLAMRTDDKNKDCVNSRTVAYLEEHKFYDTDYKDFIETVYAYYYDSESKHKWMIPRKLIFDEDSPDGYWDANFDAIDEIFSQIGKAIYYCWGEAYVSPWDTVYVTWSQPDCGGYDCERGMKTFPNWQAFLDYMAVGDPSLKDKRREE